MKKNTVLESTRSKRIIDWINLQPGCMAIKRAQAGFNRKGDPDIMACVRGQHVELETKQPGKKPTQLQVMRLEEWKASGALVAVVHDRDEVQDLFRKWGLVA